MAVYIVTGKLGSGKSLLCCWKIQEYLKRRCPVAANISLRLEHNNFCKPSNDYSRVLRLPDMPTADDLINIGFGCDHYDEEKFGGIFLDEAGIWLNSRKWNSSGRTDLLEFFLYLRKRRWDLWLIVQNIDIVDKQIRAAIAEHVVYCSRSDRFQLPIFPKLILNVLTVGLINFVKVPKFHSAICKYGVSKLSPTADTWYYRGEDYFNVYNTMQEFDSNYSAGVYSILPPLYTLRIRAYRIAKFREYLLSLPSIKPPPCTTNKAMRLTKIYFKKMRFFFTFALGLFLGGVGVFYALNSLSPSDSSITVQNSKSLIPFVGSGSSTEQSNKSTDYDALLKSAKIESIDYLPSVGRLYKFSSGDKKFTSRDLGAKYAISFKSYYEVSVKNLKTAAVYSIFR